MKTDEFKKVLAKFPNAKIIDIEELERGEEMMGNMGGMIEKSTKKCKTKMQEMQKELENKTVEAESGGGMVKVIMNGKQIVQSIDIDPSLLSSDEKEVLEDLIKAALNQAKEKVEEMSAEEMKKITGGLPLPPGMKMPF